MTEIETNTIRIPPAVTGAQNARRGIVGYVVKEMAKDGREGKRVPLSHIFAGTCRLLTEYVGKLIEKDHPQTSTMEMTTNDAVCHGAYAKSEKGHTVLGIHDATTGQWWGYDSSPQQAFIHTSSGRDDPDFIIGPFETLQDLEAGLARTYTTADRNESEWEAHPLSPKPFDVKATIDELYATLSYNILSYENSK